jgi:hypothetical protein
MAGMDFIPPPMPSAAIVCEDHTHQVHLEPAQPRVVLIPGPVRGYSIDSSGNVQGGVIWPMARIDWE